MLKNMPVRFASSELITNFATKIIAVVAQLVEH